MTSKGRMWPYFSGLHQRVADGLHAVRRAQKMRGVEEIVPGASPEANAKALASVAPSPAKETCSLEVLSLVALTLG